MRILIVKRDKLGDMLLTTPLMARLSSAIAGSEVHVLASDYSAWVVRDLPYVSRVWAYPRLRAASVARPLDFWRYWTQLRQLRAMRFDVAIAAGGEHSPRAVDKALEARAVRTIAYAPPDHAARLSDPLPPPDSGHEIERMLRLAAPLGVEPAAHAADPEFRLPAAAQAFAERWLAERGLARARYLVLGLGARRAARQPVTSQILRWTARWREAHGLQTVFMWTPGRSGNPLYPGDDDVAQPVLDAAAARSDIHPYRGPIMEALGLVWNAASSVFPDSGLMHFAAASPGGVLGLFPGPHGGPGAERWAPRGHRARWLQGRSSVAEIADEEVFRSLALP